VWIEVKQLNPIEVATNEPVREEQTIFALPFLWEKEKVAHNQSPASLRTALAWPSRSGNDVDIVVY
jgi:hypothetical protein